MRAGRLDRRGPPLAASRSAIDGITKADDANRPIRDCSSEWTELAAGGAVVALHGGGKPGAVPTGLGFEVDDIGAACVLVRETGGSIVSPPKQDEHVDLRRATAADPDGNQFSIVQTG